MSEVLHIAERARRAATRLAITSSSERDAALRAMARALRVRSAEVLAANASDLDAAREKGTPAGLLDRLALDEGRLEAIACALEAVAQLPDPIGEVISGHTMPNGIELRQVRVPMAHRRTSPSVRATPTAAPGASSESAVREDDTLPAAATGTRL